MNAHENILSEADYTARHVRLRAELQRAKAGNDRPELQAVQAEIGDDDLDAARAAVSVIEAKLRGLNAAWEEAQRQAECRRTAEATKVRREAAHEALELAAKRGEEIQAIDRIIASLLPCVKEVTEIDEAIRAALAPYSSALAANPVHARDHWADFLRELRDRTRENSYVSGALYAAGLSEWGIGQQFSGPMGDLDLLNRTKSNAVERAARCIAGEED